MIQYIFDFSNLSRLLSSFIKEGKINPEISEKEIKYLDKSLKKTQFEILIEPISDNQQNVLFNALRNLRIVIIEIKDQLKTASIRGENPTTAERCISLVPFMNNLSKVMYEFQRNKSDMVLKDISRNTRILRKKAKEYSLLTSLEKEMSEVELPVDEIKTFCESLNQNVEIVMENQ